MTAIHPQHLSESHRRLYEKLQRDLGAQISALLADQDINEIILNPDGKLWIDRASSGQSCVGDVAKEQAFSILTDVPPASQKDVVAQTLMLKGFYA